MYGTDFSADFKTTAIQMNYFSIINIVTLYDINLSTSFTRLLCVHFSFLPPPFHFSLSLSLVLSILSSLSLLVALVFHWFIYSLSSTTFSPLPSRYSDILLFLPFGPHFSPCRFICVLL